MKIDISKFLGIAPIANPLALGDGYAQVAIDCNLRGGVLAPALGARVVMALGVANVKSMHKFGWQNAAENQWWLMFNAPVHVAKAALAGDTEERTYFTGEWPPGNTKLKKSRLGMANSGVGPYPTTWLDGSVPAPTNVITVTPVGGDTSIEPERRIYVETFVTSWDEESEPGPPSARTDVYEGAVVNLTNLTPIPAGSHAIDRRRVYRLSYTGTEQSDLQLVVELPIGTTTYADSIAQIDLGSTIATEGWDAAPAGLQGLTALANQMVVGFKDFDAYFAEPRAMYAWPVEYTQALDWPIVGIGAYGQTVAYLTTGLPYIGVGASPEEIVLARAEVPESCSGCESGRGIVSQPGSVLYPTKHGIAMLSPSGAQNLLDKYVEKTQWANYAPHTMLGAAAGERYIGFYDNGAVQRGVILDPNVPGLVETSIYATAQHVNKGKLYLAVGSNLVCFEEGAALNYTWKSRKYSMPSPGNLSVGRVIAETYPATIKVYGDGILRATKVVTSNREFTLPAGYTATEWEVQVEGQAKVRRLVLAETSEELADVGT